MLSRQAAGIALVIGGGVVALGCFTIDLRPYQRIMATDGRVWTGRRNNVFARQAAVASTAHDVPCAPDDVAIVEETWDDPHLTFVTQGCGVRLTYHLPCERGAAMPSGDVLWECSFLVVGRVDLEPRAAAAPSP